MCYCILEHKPSVTAVAYFREKMGCRSQTGHRWNEVKTWMDKEK